MAVDEAALIRFLRDELDVDTSEVKADTRLFSSGLIDSFALISLLAHLEEQQGIVVQPEDVNLENLDSVERIVRFVERSMDQGSVDAASGES